ncbi:MAG TPA: orotate phosphoribosyltransferase [Thermomicrobiales bacterium]|jgi:orotate phosphoribosyltransferase|nr:orotate phosphoribosyltransferase [Thermomicrobiales bacterium]
MSDQQTVLDLFERSGALLDGHFLLASGRHSARYMEKFHLLRQPGITSEMCRGFADRYRDERIDVVVGPTTGGILLAFETARQLGVAAAYAERASDGGSAREIRRSTTFEPGSRVLIVDDIMTRGGSIRETLAALEPHPVEVVGIGVVVDRSGGSLDLGVPLAALATVDIETWEPADCPLCAAGEPLTKPGTTAVPRAGS